MDEKILFPYSDKDPKPRQVLCKNSGDGTIWCCPSIREKYAKICKDCSMNPDVETGLSTFNQGSGTP